MKSKMEKQTADFIKVAEQLWQYVNPTSSMNCPNSVYLTTEEWHKEWMDTETDLDLFDWCVKNKNYGK